MASAMSRVGPVARMVVEGRAWRVQASYSWADGESSPPWGYVVERDDAEAAADEWYAALDAHGVDSPECEAIRARYARAGAAARPLGRAIQAAAKAVGLDRIKR